MELRLSKSASRQTKCQIRINYNWDGKEANFADSVLSFVKEYLLKKLSKYSHWMFPPLSGPHAWLYVPTYRGKLEFLIPYA